MSQILSGVQCVRMRRSAPKCASPHAYSAHTCICHSPTSRSQQRESHRRMCAHSRAIHLHSSQVYMRVGVEDERPLIPPESDLPGSPGGKRLELYIELMKVGRFWRPAHISRTCVRPRAGAHVGVSA
jgi:hypothetical protein